MPKLDLLKEYKSYYKAGKKPEIREFEEAGYLTIAGKGEPAGEVFTKKVEALYPLAYGIKKICKEQNNDFGVPKLHMHGVHFQKNNDSLVIWMDMHENGKLSFKTTYELVRANSTNIEDMAR